MDKILEVKNLKISFRTSGGNVKAVRGENFERVVNVSNIRRFIDEQSRSESGVVQVI